MLLATPANQTTSACLLLSAGFLVAGDISAYTKQPASMVQWETFKDDLDVEGREWLLLHFPLTVQGTITEILEENVVQPLLVSTSAIRLATETVRSIMKIDDIVSAERKGCGPLRTLWVWLG